MNMKTTVKLTINQKQVVAEKGMTILEAARKAGIQIPTLCHDDRLKPAGDCRLCMVEIARGNRRKLVASCVHEAEDGLVVTTETEKIRRIRRLLVELTWPASSGFGKELGVTGSRFTPELMDCSLCGKCVRFCSEVAKKNAIYFKGRGVDRRPAIVPGMGDACASCVSSAECFGLCTGGWIVRERARDLANV